MVEYPKGLEGVIANESKLSLVDGKNGQLSYCGYPIADLVSKGSFEETCYLLYHQQLPAKDQLEAFTQTLRSHRSLPQGIIDFLQSAPKESAPMDVLRTAISMLGLFYPSTTVSNASVEQLQSTALSLVAKTPIIVAYFHRIRQGLNLPEIRPDLSEASHFLYLATGKIPSEKTTKVLDAAYILHADHSTNASTFSARVTIATLTDFYSAITSAVGTLKGPLHGGANEGVIHMLQEIGDLKKVDAYIEDKLTNKGKIMGIGHRVYKVLDPRAPLLKQMAIELTQELGETKWIKMSERIAELMLERKGLNANVDFYSATVYYSLGIQTDLFTPIFAISRMAGWTAQVLEQLADNRLFRPATLYTGEIPPRLYPELSSR